MRPFSGRQEVERAGRRAGLPARERGCMSGGEGLPLTTCETFL